MKQTAVERFFALMRTPIRLRRAKPSAGIGTQAGPQGMMESVYSSRQGAPPLLNTRALLEGYDSMPWLRAVADKIGTSISLVDWQLYMTGAPPAAAAASADTYTMRAEDIAAGVAAAVGAEVSRAVRRVRGRAEPWARRDHSLQRAPSAERWRAMKALRKRGQLQKVEDHLLYDALDDPNPFMGGSGLMKLTETSLDLVGDAFWLKQRNGSGAPAGFWPVPAHWVTETPTPLTPRYRIAWNAWQRYIPASEILWFHEPAPVHPYERGSGVGFAVGDELEIDEYLSKMTKQLFFNDADPKWIMALGDAGEPEVKRLEHDFLSRNQGFWKKFKPYFLRGGGPNPNINQMIHEFQRPTMEQLVYPGLRKAQRDVVLQVPGIPPEMFGIVESSNRATIEAAEHLYSKWVVLPRLERLRSIMQASLLPDYDDRLLLDYPNPVARDKEHDLNVMKAAPWAWDADAWREKVGDEPLADGAGRAYNVPLNSYVTPTLNEPPPMTTAQRIEAVGALVRAGFDPAGALGALGLPPVEHIGLPPVTVQAPRAAAPFADQAPGDAAPDEKPTA